MSKLQELIRELCPDGVGYRKLGEVCEIKRGVRITKAQVLQEGEGKYPVISGGMNPLGYLNEFNRNENTITIAKYGSAGFVNWQKEKFWANDVCYSLFPQKILDNRFLYYVLYNSQDYLYQLVNRDAIPYHLPQIHIEKLCIPVPPLVVQEEIVRILDHFTNLAAELQARKEQYEYYRDKLLSFNNINGGYHTGVTWMKMSEIGNICMCKRIMKEQTNNIGGVPFYKIGTFGKVADAYISRELYEDYKNRFSFPVKGEVLISASGTIGRSVIYDGEDAYFQDSNIVWVHNDETKVLNKYLYHYYRIIEWNVEGGTIKRLYNSNLAKTKIAVPSLPEQERIVNILDKFENLTTDLQTGLPAEIAAVQEQYEYYRNKLLSFPRKSA